MTMPGEHERSPLPRLGNEPAHERRLADAGFPADEHQAALTRERGGESRAERRLLARPSDEQTGRWLLGDVNQKSPQATWKQGRSSSSRHSRTT